MKTLFALFIALFVSFSIIGQGNALHFDGTDDYVSFNSNPSPNFGLNDDFTIEVWVKAPANQIDLGGFTNVIIFKGRPATSIPYSIRIGNGSGDVANGIVAFRRVNNLGSIIQLYSSSAINDDAWHHIAIVKQGVNLHLYIDGVMEDSDSDFISGNTNDNNSMSFGARMPLNDFFLGELDEIRIWGDARTGSEINAMIESELTGMEDNLLRYFNCNQGIPAGDNTSIGRLLDFARVVGRHGFLNGFTLNGSTSNFVASDFQIFMAVPTLGQWGTISLTLLIFIFGVNGIRSKNWYISPDKSV